MDIVDMILRRANTLLTGKSRAKINLQPNPNLRPVEQHLQSLLLSLIDEFGNIGLMIDVVGPDPKMVQAWSEAQTSSFTHVISQFKWE